MGEELQHSYYTGHKRISQVCMFHTRSWEIRNQINNILQMSYTDYVSNFIPFSSHTCCSYVPNFKVMAMSVVSDGSS